MYIRIIDYHRTIIVLLNILVDTIRFSLLIFKFLIVYEKRGTSITLQTIKKKALGVEFSFILKRQLKRNLRYFTLEERRWKSTADERCFHPRPIYVRYKDESSVHPPCSSKANQCKFGFSSTSVKL